jgi:transposase-like protein
MNNGAQISRERRISRQEEYFLIGGDRLPGREAARRLGLNPRTVWRWRRAWREEAARQKAAS